MTYTAGPDWFDYLKSTGVTNRYRAACDCVLCRDIRAGYRRWKASRRDAETQRGETEESRTKAQSAQRGEIGG